MHDRLLLTYTARTVALAMAGVLLVFIALNTLFAVVDELDAIKNAYGAPEVATYIALSTPRRIYDLIPFVALLGAVIGLGILSGSSELTIMRASGVSTRRVIAFAGAPGVILIVAGLVLGEYVIPVSEQAADRLRQTARSPSGTYVDSRGYWHRDGADYVHVAVVHTGGLLEGITRYQTDGDGEVVALTHAERANYLPASSTEPGYWLLQNVTTTNITDTGSDVVRQPTAKWYTEAAPDILVQEVMLEPDKLSITSLLRQVRYMESRTLDAGEYQLALWTKLMQPLAIVALVFLAATFVIGALRGVTMSVRILLGVLAGVAFRYAQDLLGPASLVFGFPPVVAAVIPVVLVGVVAAILLRRAG